ncbi:MAG: hypothetical protein EB078_10360 [Proteobacteria bacterium]|nr:hypothetical protein [Pseudomonadota bacterium]NDC25437.1 hypothetical protein [Pseudomonadota bacterium]NDD05298.1 hypothetical protein [Pseudomonadota bacterium]NDG27769.1 hypothetical protein [Pseudomonadota bacterium]
MKKIICLIALVITNLTYASFMADFRLERRFGVGLGVGGPLSVLGLEVEFNLSSDVSLVGGIGSGHDYSTFAARGKYFFLGDQVSPYFLLGFARWWSQGTTQTDVGPAVLKNIFLQGEDPRQGFSVWTVYPGIGVQFIHDSGFSMYAEAHYLFKMPSFSNGTYAGLGASWFF